MIARRRSRPFDLALGFSILFHLSMVTLFRIVIYFPRPEIDYMNVDIVRVSAPAEQLTLGNVRELGTSDPFDRLAELQGGAPSPVQAVTSALPAIELPTLRFDELDRLRFRMQGLEVGKRYDARFGPGSGDLWSRFGRGIGSVTEALTSAVRGAPEELGPEPIALSNPAPGFYAYIEWTDPPYNREALGIAKIEALWGLEPDTMSEAIAFPFRVDPSGNVLEVLRPLEGERAVVEGAMQSLRSFRFEARDDAPRAQSGALVIGGKGGWRD